MDVEINSRWLCGVAVSIIAICGCGEEDFTSVRFAVSADGSGSAVVAALRVESGEGDPLRPATMGVDWEPRRASVVMQKGTFRDVSRVVVGGVRAALSSKEGGGHVFRLTVPLGEEAKWPGLIGAIDENRDFVLGLCRTDTELPSLGKEPRFKFTVTMPGVVTEHRCTPDITSGSAKSSNLFSFGGKGKGKGDAGSSDNRAYLVIPMAAVRGQKEKELVWKVACEGK